MKHTKEKINDLIIDLKDESIFDWIKLNNMSNKELNNISSLLSNLRESIGKVEETISIICSNRYHGF